MKKFIMNLRRTGMDDLTKNDVVCSKNGGTIAGIKDLKLV